jgi:two-component sensor histidine kinase
MEAGTLELRASSPDDVTTARHVLEARLLEWGCARAGDVLVVFSELVTNAVKYAGGAARIVLHTTHEMIRIAVYDADHRSPEMRPQGGASGGFGLRIVDELTVDWGWRPTADGKEVWAELSCRG